ncbi:scavenger receptor class F member 2-like [Mizuhopecten yessoensis]|uniref:scavenger receptor class F member 2-like n=1 Tax=Mizuhopecten yessoensis TaxID=6573 RepID=UPI000B45D21A|nr:scavenger receptor class F member 2-like [Mizuhopecten yessoensis]
MFCLLACFFYLMYQYNNNTSLFLVIDLYQNRFAGYQLYLSNTTESPTQSVLCFEDKSSTKAQVQLLVTHQCPYVARYVIVYNYRNNPKRYTWYYDYAVLELCEVQVFGCQVGRYGDGDCNSQCSGNCYGGNCNSTTGSCFYCFPGKYGDYCNNDCSTNCKNSTCEKDTGYCSGCIPGKKGDMCNTNCSSHCVTCKQTSDQCFECVNGKHGDVCDLNCSDNCEDKSCMKDNGYCLECVNGKHGDVCDLNCSDNCKDQSCMKDNGYCLECVPGKHGNECASDCSDNCKDKTCMKNNGNCTGCITGKTGALCDTNCSSYCETCDQTSEQCFGNYNLEIYVASVAVLMVKGVRRDVINR